jgi:NADPH-dependent glutamate synthase beta subunit-like oxidoreductase
MPRGTLDESVAIRELKRYVADYAYKNERPYARDVVFPKNGKRVAVIGPARRASPADTISCGSATMWTSLNRRR